MEAPHELQHTRAGRSLRLQWALGWLTVLIALASVTWLGPVPEHAAPALTAVFVAGLAWWRLSHLSARWAPSSAWIVAGAVLLRLVVLAGEPGLSDDVHRYVWEAEVVAEGISPYAHAPDSERLEFLRTRLPELHAGVNHPETPAAYPPVVQAYGHLAVRVARAVGAGPENGVPGAVLVLRLFAAACDLLVLIPLALLLRLTDQPRGRLVVWAWSPLVALEFAGSAHFDALGIALWVAALALLSARPARLAPGLSLLACAILTKFLPLVSLPFALRGPRRRALAGAALVLVLTAFITWPFSTLEGGLRTGGLGDYGLRWESTSLFYRFVEPPLAALFEHDGSWTDPRRLGRASILLLWLGTGAWVWTRGWDLVRSSWILIAMFLVLSPTLHPWYLAWAVPFLALRPSAAWSWLVVSMPLGYVLLVRWWSLGVWQEPSWLWPLLCVPFLALLGLERWRSRR